MSGTPNDADYGADATVKSPFDELFAKKTSIRPIRANGNQVPDSGRRVGYARVSRSVQTHDRQTDVLKEAGCETCYEDIFTGRSLARPQFKEMCYSLKPGDTVMVTQLDRLGRSTIDTLRIISAFNEHQVRLIVLNMGLDTATAQGRFAITLFAALAEIEAEFVQERTHAGLEAARRRGRVGGRRQVISKGKAAKILELRGIGLGVPAISAQVQVSQRSIYRFLKERADNDEAESDAFYIKYDVEDV